MNARLPPPSELAHLSVEERLELLEIVWASLQELPEDAVPAPEWHKAEVEARLAALDEGNSIGAPWAEVRDRILQKR